MNNYDTYTHKYTEIKMYIYIYIYIYMKYTDVQ